jgi:hypothetical protein
MIESSATAEALKQEAKENEKKRAHLFKKGQVANPNGRPKGSKNKLTLLREAILMDAEEIVLSNWESVVRKTLDMAEQGDSTALKILWDRVIPSKRAIDTSKTRDDKMNITINVSGLEVKSVMAEDDEDIIEAEIIDGDS